MVDDFDGDLAGLGFGEWAALGAVDAGPSRFVNLGAQRALEVYVGFAGTDEVGVADEKAFAVVVGVDEPASDIVGGGVADFSGRRILNTEAFGLDLKAPFGLGQRMVSDIFNPLQNLSRLKTSSSKIPSLFIVFFRTAIGFINGILDFVLLNL